MDAFLGDLGSSEGGSDVTDEPMSNIGDEDGVTKEARLIDEVMLDHTRPDDDMPVTVCHRVG